MTLTDTDTRPPKPSPAVTPDSVLVVIPTLNEAKHIESCIRSLVVGDERVEAMDIIVADGGSTDDTVAIVKDLQSEFPGLKLLNNPDRLQSAAINLAAETCATPKHRYLVRCDAHSLYPSGFVMAVAHALNAKEAASVVVPMDATGTTCFEKANSWIVDTPLGSGGSAHRGGRRSQWIDHGHHAGFDLAWFRKIGGYDATFSHNEDAEYDARLTAAGGSIWMDANIRIQYVPRGTVSGLARQYFNYGKGRARNIRKHNGRLKLRQAAPILALLGSVFGLIAGFLFWPAFLLPLGYVGILVAASIGVAIWKRSLCGLLSGLASGTMHMSWAAGYLKQLWFGNKSTPSG